MPLITSSSVAALCGVWYAWRRRRARDQRFFFLADTAEPDRGATKLAQADTTNEVECNLQSLGAEFDRLRFHMSISAGDALLNVVRVDGRHFEVAFYLDSHEDSETIEHVRKFFARHEIEANQDSRSRVSNTITLQVIDYPIGTSAQGAAEICVALLRTVYRAADGDVITVRRSRSVTYQ